jgi:glycosyltransferase involved in cell wall biosynthesis
MHVGISLLTLSPGRAAGGESIVRGLLTEFADGNGPERVTVLANREVQDSYGDLARGPVTLARVRGYRPGKRAATRALAVTTARLVPGLVARDVPRDLDVIHFPLTVPVPAARTATVVTIHDVLHHDLPELFPRSQQRYRRWAYDGAASRAGAVVTDSHYTRERLIERVGIVPERIEVIYPGVEHIRFHPNAADDARLLEGRDLPERFVIYPANLWHHKNHDGLLEAFASVRTDLELVLTGHAYRRLKGVIERARGLGISDRVQHLGYVPDAVVPALYRRAEAMVFPSLYEGFGLPPVEAMACGCPVAASTRGSLAEACGDAALSFDPDDVDSIAEAIANLDRDAGLRARLRVAGLRHAARFTWADAAARHLEVYARAANAR